MSTVQGTRQGEAAFHARRIRRRQSQGSSSAASLADCNEAVCSDKPWGQQQHAQDGDSGRGAALQRLTCEEGSVDSSLSSLSSLSSSQGSSARGSDDGTHPAVGPASELLHRSGPAHETESASSDDEVQGVRYGSTPSSDSDERPGWRADCKSSFPFVDSDELREREASGAPSCQDAVRDLSQDVLRDVPLDDDGEYTSIGSIGHNTGHCTPCAFRYAKKGCRAGIACMRCHFPHKGKPTGKRRQYEKKKERRAQVHVPSPQRDSHSPRDGSERHAGAASSEMASRAVTQRFRHSRQLTSL